MTAFTTSLQDVIDSGGQHGLPALNRRGFATHYQCSCGQWRLPACIIDCRKVAGTVGQPWACDGCTSTWLREGRNVDGGESAPADAKEWRIRWAQLHKAKPEFIDRINGNRPAEPYGRIKNRV